MNAIRPQRMIGLAASARASSLALTLVLSLASAGLCSAQDLIAELAWAYAITPGPAPTPPVDDGTLHSLAGSDRSFTLDQIRNRLGPADWFPGDHPSMPPIVAVGREQGAIWACGLCHYPNGKGRPENAGVVGLPKEYFIQQLHDFKNGLRHSAEPLKANTELMAGFALAMTDAEIEESAAYFSSMPWTAWIEVVETQSVPKTRVQGGMHLRLEGAEAGMEPIGRRIIETPKNAEHTELLRNPRSGFIAYVPVGAVARGEALVRTQSGKTTPCTICHGEDLNGLAFVPSLRGRSPSYTARQLADFKQGTRHGAWAPLMSPVVANLTADDMLNLSAYLASLPPNP
ncbi:MAG TPA: c-type cytochrome [Gammaproteobacteria bacterium]|nr:c-type cytochrome [Gammaproteobacteria bacterium]